MDIATQKYISVIIPIYNTESYLSRCLKSVCSQTLSEIEIICINDGSTDKSAGIIKKFADKDKRIKVITQPNKGLSAARNIGLDSCQGDYIFFLDADDYLQPQALEIFYKTACKSNCEVVISSEFTKLKKNPKDRNKPINTDNVAYKICKSPLRDLYKHRYVSAIVWNKLYKRETIMPFRFIEGIYFEDWPFTTCLFSSLKEFALINEKLYMYNNASPSTVRSRFTVKKVRDYMRGIRYVYEYFTAHNLFKDWEVVRRKRISTSLKMVLSKIYKSKDNKTELERCFKTEYDTLAAEHIVFFKELTFKSKIRYLLLKYHLRKN